MPGKETLFKIQGSPKSTVYSLHLHSNLFEVLPADFTDTRVSLWYTVGRCSCSLWIRHDHCQNAEQLWSPRNPHEIRPVNIASWIGNPKGLMNFPTKPLPSPSLFKTQIIGWGWDSSVLLPFLSPPCWGWDFLWSSSQSHPCSCKEPPKLHWLTKQIWLGASLSEENRCLFTSLLERISQRAASNCHPYSSMNHQFFQ